MSSTNRGKKRTEKDAYPTPSWCTEVLLPEIVWGENPWILEPCVGDGAILDVIRPVAGVVEVCEIAEPYNIDFLTYQPKRRMDFVVTNPPFSLAQEFIERSLELANCVIMLLPLGFHGSEGRHEWWTRHEPTAQFTLSRRPSFGLNKDGKWGTDSETYAWLCWDSTGRQKRGIYHLNPTDEQYKRSVTEFRKRYGTEVNANGPGQAD